MNRESVAQFFEFLIPASRKRYRNNRTDPVTPMTFPHTKDGRTTKETSRERNGEALSPQRDL